MADLLTWSVPLGRWRDTQYRLHYILIVFATLRLLEGLVSERHNPADSVAWAVAIALALAIHELAHALVAERLELHRPIIYLWPLGDLNRPGSTPGVTPREQMLVALAGPVASLGLALTAMISLAMFGARMQLDPFGGTTFGQPIRPDGTTLGPLTFAGWVGCLGHASWLLALANLIPALPFDGGSAVRGWQRTTFRDTDLSPYLARAAAVILGIAGLFRLYFTKPGALSLLAIALVIELVVRWEARRLEETGQLGDELFGYDFSQGYTSLDSSAPVVRPRRESALARWHRRRSESRRRRLVARQSADEKRLDEILDKIHREGRAALTTEENRFLVQQSQRKKSHRSQSPE